MRLATGAAPAKPALCHFCISNDQRERSTGVSTRHTDPPSRRGQSCAIMIAKTSARARRPLRRLTSDPREIEAWLLRLRVQVRRRVKQDWREINAVVAALLERRILSGQEIGEILESGGGAMV